MKTDISVIKTALKYIKVAIDSIKEIKEHLVTKEDFAEQDRKDNRISFIIMAAIVIGFVTMLVNKTLKESIF